MKEIQMMVREFSAQEKTEKGLALKATAWRSSDGREGLNMTVNDESKPGAKAQKIGFDNLADAKLFAAVLNKAVEADVRITQNLPVNIQ